jgi:hypothetical protein
VHLALKGLLKEYEDVFADSAIIRRSCDHAILLLPNFKPINLRSYRYYYYQRIEIKKKIIEELLHK